MNHRDVLGLALLGAVEPARGFTVSALKSLAPRGRRIGRAVAGAAARHPERDAAQLYVIDLFKLPPVERPPLFLGSPSGAFLASP